MKMFISVTLFCLLIPNLLFAATQVGSLSGTVYTVPANGSYAAWSVSLSKKVDFKYYPGPSGVSFVATAGHTSGDKVYASGGSITKIYYYNGTSAPALNPPLTENSAVDFSGWNEL